MSAAHVASSSIDFPIMSEALMKSMPFPSPWRMEQCIIF